MNAPRLAQAAALAVLVLLACPAAGAKSGDPVVASAYTSIDDVTYYLAAGRLNGSGLAHDAGAGERLLDFQGCVLTQFRPDHARGRVSIDGFVDGVVPVRLNIADFEAAGSVVKTNATVTPSEDAALPAGTSTVAELAARGTAEMHAGLVIRDNNQPGLANFTDPITGDQDLQASVFVTRDGLRDDGDQSLQSTLARDDEIHLVVESRGTGKDAHFVMGPQASTPDGSAFPQAEHSAVYPFINDWYGGVATFDLTLTSHAPPGEDEMTIIVYDPLGDQVGNATVSASVLQSGHAQLQVPLDEMGEYLVVAHGKLLLGNYAIDTSIAAPKAFRLDFFWEQVARGADARGSNSGCLVDLGTHAQVQKASVLRHLPPLFPMELVALSAVVILATVLMFVKYVNEATASAEFNRAFKK